MKRPISTILLITAILLGSCRSETPTVPQPEMPTTATEEIHGVWVSYLELDGLLAGASTTDAAARLDGMLDTCKESGINTIFFHVRAHSDAYYASTVYPPATAVKTLLADGFDPLAYTIRAAHQRALSLHAWINPYRIGTNEAVAVTDGDTDIFQRDGVWYYNPASPDARRAVLDGVREILARYAVDGIHFDDYFYPAGMTAQAESFETVPDGIAVSDWRRTQVDLLVSGVHGLTRAAGRVFGISPSGLIDACRDTAYADVARWMADAGYIDYLCPQIYFGFTHATHPFSDTLAAWEALPRHDGVALYVGLALYKAGTDDAYAGGGRTEWQDHNDVIARQVAAIRASGAANGFALFRFAHLTTAKQEMTNLKALL